MTSYTKRLAITEKKLGRCLLRQASADTQFTRRKKAKREFSPLTQCARQTIQTISGFSRKASLFCSILLFGKNQPREKRENVLCISGERKLMEITDLLSKTKKSTERIANLLPGSSLSLRSFHPIESFAHNHEKIARFESLIRNLEFQHSKFIEIHFSNIFSLEKNC